MVCWDEKHELCHKNNYRDNRLRSKSHTSSLDHSEKEDPIGIWSHSPIIIGCRYNGITDNHDILREISAIHQPSNWWALHTGVHLSQRYCILLISNIISTSRLFYCTSAARCCVISLSIPSPFHTKLLLLCSGPNLACIRLVYCINGVEILPCLWSLVIRSDHL